MRATWKPDETYGQFTTQSDLRLVGGWPSNRAPKACRRASRDGLRSWRDAVYALPTQGKEPPVRNAVARFDQIDAVLAERAMAFANIEKAAGVELS